VINDFAHCLGTVSGFESAFGFVSFAPTKIVGAGKGGALLTDLCGLGFEAMRDFGRGERGEQSLMYGKNFKMSEFDAAMVLSGLPFLNEIIERQRRVFDFYNKELSVFEDEGVIVCLDKRMRKGWRSNCYQYCVMLKGPLREKREKIEDYMLREGVECWRKQNPDFTDRIFLPCHAYLTEEDLRAVVDVFGKALFEVLEK
jgi:dTDP-4-amino-4,6-dideoxygalactose transaminase